jgi:acyl-CoA reductase-like NAD-dependent aldehyde dehydrogenase
MAVTVQPDGEKTPKSAKGGTKSATKRGRTSARTKSAKEPVVEHAENAEHAARGEAGRDPASFASFSPATGETVGEFPVHDETAVTEAVARAKEAAKWWAGLGWKERRTRLLNIKGSITRQMGRIAKLVHVETGKPVGDAQIEIIGAILHLDWAAKNARKVLGPRSVFPGITAINQKATLLYQPLGVVGVIGPWNYPVFTPMGSIAYALAAGNTVVFKPSEYTPAMGRLLGEIVNSMVPEHPIVQVVTGFGETGAALASSRVDKLAFTGSAATARRVMAACAANLTPMVAECGGKDAFIVDTDADVDAAVDAAVWGAMSNAGQTCVGVERVYVTEPVYDEFVTKLTEQAAALRPGEDRAASYGPITMPKQLPIIQRHIDDALAQGGQAILGGTDAVQDPYVAPTVLTDLPDDAAANREETFGPTITVTKVKDAEEALTKANATEYGLGGTVFAGDRTRAAALARRLRGGMTAINDIISFASIPALPFGGVGESGFGRIHGADGLREFAHSKAITRRRFQLMIKTTTFRRTDEDMDKLVKLTQLMHGRRYK